METMNSSTIDQLIGDGNLQITPGHRVHATDFLNIARQHLAGADVLLEATPAPALALSVSAVRSALIGVLAHHDIALTKKFRGRSDKENDDIIVAAATELAGRDRFPELDELRQADEDWNYGPATETARDDARRWVTVAGTIVATAEELIALPNR
jgi:HEPN domain-containing protein